MTASPPVPLAPPPRPGTGRGRFALVILGLALLFGVLEAWQGRFLFPDVPPENFWPEALIRAMPSWLILALLMPGVIGLSRVLRLDGPNREVAALAHVTGGIVFVALHLGLTSLVAALRPGGDPDFWGHLSRFLYRYTVGDFILYCAIVGALHIYWHQSERRAREVAESELRAQLAEARLGALRAQLHPHFLFNTLNAISTLAMRGERERLVGAIDALCQLLRVALDERHGSLSTLDQELQFVDRYFEIQTLRFGERLRMERDVAADAGAGLVPSLLLQPLVENAIEHGIARRPGPGRIVIRAAREDLVLWIEIADTGPGFGDAPGAPEHLGVGLANTRARLDQLFGPRASIECVNAPEGGARVTVRLPWVESRPAAEDARAGVGP